LWLPTNQYIISRDRLIFASAEQAVQTDGNDAEYGEQPFLLKASEDPPKAEYVCIHGITQSCHIGLCEVLYSRR
jgi:hypothetical protein